MEIGEKRSSAPWTWVQEKMFENAVADYIENLDENWEKFAESVPGKGLEELASHCRLLIEDVEAIESGRVPLPDYPSSSGDMGCSDDSLGDGNSGGHESDRRSGKTSNLVQKRRKGKAWSEEEHRLFLLGLEKHGKGDWRSISRNYVVTRTPTQVASHAQKYFLRVNSGKNERRRPSIHDITSANAGDASNSMPMNAQMNPPIPISGISIIEAAEKQVPPGPDSNDAAIGPSVDEGVVSATAAIPIRFSFPNTLQMSYGIEASCRTMFLGEPDNLSPNCHSSRSQKP